MTCNNVHQKAHMAPNNDIDPIKLAIVVGSTRDGRAAERPCSTTSPGGARRCGTRAAAAS